MFEPIAIVGRSCILPGASSPEELWTAVAAGRDLVSSAPADRWGVPPDLALTPDPSASADRAWSDRGGYVRGFAFADELAVDPFARTAEDLLALDPLFHWVLSAGRKALREAGHDRPSARVGAAIGNLSFPSSTMSRYAEHVWFGRPTADPRNRFMSGLPALLLADQLGLGGGAFALDAACASSLYAIGLACERLHDRTLDLALAGAVCRSDDLFIHVGFCALDAMSRSGRSRPFHREADGLVPAEGAAFVALKRLSDAEAAGDRIFGVIRGVGLSNDGRGRGLLAPSSEGQARALRRAWRASGLDPARLGLVECHATGTPVGDAAEIHTMHEVFGGAVRELPIGSLKSNLGHLITAAGAAGLLKVLGAFEAGIRPPTLHAELPNEALAGTPFRLVHAAEPWPSEGPRLAALSAFGFGGNNAHVVVEQYEPGAGAAITPSPPAPRGALAVVGLGVRVGDGASTAAFVDDLAAGRSRIVPGTPARAAARSVTLPLDKVRFPPRDLQQTLPQQLSILDAALEAVGASALPRESTAVLIGSQSDPEVCRYGARWRMRGWDRATPAATLDAITPVLASAGVVGNMPNIPANRLGSQFDWGGPGFTVSAEELSGTEALRIAARWLRAGDVDAAVVGAVDLSAEIVHETAARLVLPPRTSGDAAVVLVLRRLDDARRDGSPILAILPDDPTDSPDGPVVLGGSGVDLSAQFGVAHAAHGLLHVAAAVASVAYGLRPESGPWGPWTGARAARVDVRGMTGDR
ncbi:MAG: beta-ketoacyl synthase N-terminal-like domain-containing protein, partial [Myxococcota bacterium]